MEGAAMTREKTNFDLQLEGAEESMRRLDERLMAIPGVIRIHDEYFFPEGWEEIDIRLVLMVERTKQRQREELGPHADSLDNPYSASIEPVTPEVPDDDK
jgi:hypothetical protein